MRYLPDTIAPESLAVAGPQPLSYAGLSDRADAIARAAWRAGLRQGGRAALLLPRGADAVAAMLAIRRIGAAYVPVDPVLPAPARDALLADADPAVLLTDGPVAAGCPVLRLDQALPDAAAYTVAAPNGEAVACIMYTSGSSGRPKGVVVPQPGVLRLVTGPGLRPLRAAARRDAAAWRPSASTRPPSRSGARC